MRNFMGKGDFVWWIGVVEDRNDPVQMGRVRVRCFGWHTDDKGKIPTDSLPWALTVNGIQSASVSGVGHTPTGLVEGAWVVGFFMDGDRAQEPIVIGSLTGVPVDPADTTKGFNDPWGDYPKWTREPDTNIAARESLADVHMARQQKNLNRIEDIPMATAPSLSTVVDDKRNPSYYDEKYWSELPAANDLIPEYPHNHVYETENGHLQEFDDTEGKERYHRYHPSGTYEEIINDGTRTIKVIGKDYELYMDGVNMYVVGDLNVTVRGNKRELITGNYHLKVQGETTFDLAQSWQTKIGGSLNQEIGHDRTVNVTEKDYLSVLRGDQKINILLGEQDTIVGRGITTTTSGSYTLTSVLGTNLNSLLTTRISAATTIGINSGIGIETETWGYIKETAVGFKTSAVGLTSLETVGGWKTELIGGIHTVEVGGAQNINVGGAQNNLVGGAIFSGAGATYTMGAGGVLTAIAPLINLNPL
jgi:hypothetical protein